MMHRIGPNTWRRSNPFVPFPFPNLFFMAGPFAIYPLWPWQKYFWVMPQSESEWAWHFGPFFVASKQVPR